MNLIKFSVHRPVTVFMLLLIVISLGVFSYTRLAIDLMPDISFPILTIQTEYEGISPHEIESLITRPIEEVASTVEGIEELTSSSQEGRSVVRIRFKWGENLEEVANDLRAKLDRIVNRLPEDANKPILFKFDLNALPIMWVGISGNMSRIKLRTYAEKELKNRFEQIRGVAQVDIRGGLEREIQVNLRYKDLQAKQISTQDVITALKNENLDFSIGDFRSKKMKYNLRSIGKFKSLDEIKKVIIKSINGINITIDEVADVIDTHKDITTFIRVNGKNALLFRIIKQPDGNTVEIAERIRKKVMEIQNSDASVELAITRDVSTYIKRAIANVQRAAVYGGVIAVIVLMVFLRNIRSTFIISAAMIISIIATFIFINSIGFTLNMMSFGGLALGIGMLVDNSVVVIENIFSHSSENKSSQLAAINGTTEVASAISVSTITTAIVFLPLFFFQGTSGVMFSQLAYMVSFSLFASLIVALTMIPSFSAKFIKVKSLNLENKLGQNIARFFNSLEESYTSYLTFFIDNKYKTLSSFLVITALIFLLFRFLGLDYMPVTDEGEVRINAELEVGTKVEVTDNRFKEMEEILIKDFGHYIENIYTRIGRASHRTLAENAGYMSVLLKENRTISSLQLSKKIRERFKSYKDMKLRVRPGSFFIFRILRGGEDRISIELRGHDLKKSDELAKKLIKELTQIKGITDLRQSREFGSPEYVIRMKRRKIQEAGLSVSEVGEYLQTAILGKVASRFSDGEYEYDILVRINPEEVQNLKSINNLLYTIDEKNKIYLKNLIDIKRAQGPMVIERLNQQRVNYLKGGIGDRDTGTILKDIKTKVSEVKFPQFFFINYGGIFEEQEKAYNDLYIGIILASLLVYMVMAAQFESFRAPLVIIFTVPFSFAGVVLIFYITNVTFTIQGFIGTIMLTGIVVNNSIVLVDFIQKLSERGLTLKESVIEAGRKRLRPILMTSLTTVLALIPLAIGIGEGSEVQTPMALSVIGGLSFSTFISLFLIPCIYLVFFRKKNSN